VYAHLYAIHDTARMCNVGVLEGPGAPQCDKTDTCEEFEEGEIFDFNGLNVRFLQPVDV
jgi:hypothetical protein